MGRRENHAPRVALAWLVGLLVAWLLAACGGGGGGAEAGPSASVSVGFDRSPATLTDIEGYSYRIEVFATINYTGKEDLYVVLEERSGLVVDGDFRQTAAGLAITLDLNPALPAGVHTGELILSFCLDPACTRPVPGSPARLPLRVELKPQIKIQAPAAMRRVGREAAPSQVLALDFRPEMGTPTLNASGAMQAYDISLQGDRIVIATKQLPAGQYSARVEVTGSADFRYRKSVELSYTVEPPPGGQLPLSASPSRFDLTMVQGTRSTHRFRVQRPTWTDAFEPLTITDTTVLKSVRHLGNDEYEATIDTAGVPVYPPAATGTLSYAGVVMLSAGEYGGLASVGFVVSLNPPVLLGNANPSWELTAATTLADLRQSSTVTMPDGAAVRWTATSNQPWLKVLRGSGITGIDELQFELDRSVVDLPDAVVGAALTVSVARAGTVPFEVPVVVANRIPRFDMASPGVLLGPTARVRLHGDNLHSGELLPGRGLLQVEGATLVGVSSEFDTRFVGSIGALAVDLDGIVPGRAITIRVSSPIKATQVVLSATAVPRVPSGYAALPLASYRAPSYAPGQQALVFAGRDAVWRWPLGNAEWAAPQSAPLAGLLDATFAPDESVIYALVGNTRVVALAPQSMALLREGALDAYPGLETRSRFETTMPANASALRFGSDGRALVPIVGAPPFGFGRGVSWLAGCAGRLEGPRADIARDPCLADPGTNLFWPEGPGGVALARSAHGGAIAVSSPTGASLIYKGLVERYVTGPDLAGRWIVAINDAGDRMVRSDGVLIFSGSTATVDLQRAVPTGHVAGGFGLTGNGAFALVYGYRVATEAAGPRARDARLYMVDLRRGAAALTSPPVVAAAVALPEAVGCTAPLAGAETCSHTAQVLVAPGDGSAFVLGPRGVAAVALAQPATVGPSKPAPGFRKGTSPLALVPPRLGPRAAGVP